MTGTRPTSPSGARCRFGTRARHPPYFFSGGGEYAPGGGLGVPMARRSEAWKCLRHGCSGPGFGAAGLGFAGLAGPGGAGAWSAGSSPRRRSPKRKRATADPVRHSAPRLGTGRKRPLITPRAPACAAAAEQHSKRQSLTLDTNITLGRGALWSRLAGQGLMATGGASAFRGFQSMARYGTYSRFGPDSRSRTSPASTAALPGFVEPRRNPSTGETRILGCERDSTGKTSSWPK